jgi:hypothetical protein
LKVAVVQYPLTTVAEAVAETRRALVLKPGPVVLDGHSWSGTLVSEAGDDPLVGSPAYVAARAPEAGEDFPALAKQFPSAPAAAGIVVAPDG